MDEAISVTSDFQTRFTTIFSECDPTRRSEPPPPPQSAGPDSQPSAHGNQGECTIWQIDAHLDANSTSLSDPEVGSLENYSVLQRKIGPVREADFKLQ
jgi:hypothetical protein